MVNFTLWIVPLISTCNKIRFHVILFCSIMLPHLNRGYHTSTIFHLQKWDGKMKRYFPITTLFFAHYGHSVKLGKFKCKIQDIFTERILPTPIIN